MSHSTPIRRPRYAIWRDTKFFYRRPYSAFQRWKCSWSSPFFPRPLEELRVQIARIPSWHYNRARTVSSKIDINQCKKYTVARKSLPTIVFVRIKWNFVYRKVCWKIDYALYMEKRKYLQLQLEIRDILPKVCGNGVIRNRVRISEINLSSCFKKQSREVSQSVDLVRIVSARWQFKAYIFQKWFSYVQTFP